MATGRRHPPDLVAAALSLRLLKAFHQIEDAAVREGLFQADRTHRGGVVARGFMRANRFAAVLLFAALAAGDASGRTLARSFSRPPGAANPKVTQANIKKTVCRANWTKTIRPPEQLHHHRAEEAADRRLWLRRQEASDITRKTT